MGGHGPERNQQTKEERDTLHYAGCLFDMTLFIGVVVFHSCYVFCCLDTEPVVYRIYLIGEKERDNSPKGVFLLGGLVKKKKKYS